MFENDFDISMRIWRRIYKLSWVSGLILAAPLLVGTLWYAWSTYATIDRYRRAMGDGGKIDLGLFQIALHDELAQDLRWLRLRPRPEHGQIPTLSLSLSRDSIDGLSAQLEQPGDNAYVKGLLEKDGRVHEITVRYRGDQPWQILGVQKSLKVQLKRGDLLDGVRTFNLLNDPTPFGLEDQLILDLAREGGLLAPELHPVWLRLNNHDLGVYRFVPQPDETLVRRGQRIPGNMYSGDTEETNPERRIGALFESDRGWQKVATRSQVEPDDRQDLLRFLEAINRGSFQRFAEYADTELDLPRWAFFDALDVIFAGSEHDYYSNQKVYADPYRGKLEPVAFSFRGFQHEEGFNIVDHPLLLRLKQTPDYLAQRDRAIYQLLTGPASVPAIRDRADRAIAALSDELAADPYWDAYKLLPRATKLHRFFPRPMTLDRWALAAEAELEGYAIRSRFLLDALEDPGLTVERLPYQAGARGTQVARLDLLVSGHAAYQVQTVRSDAPCEGRLSVYADTNLDGAFEPSDELAAQIHLGEIGAFQRRRNLSARAKLAAHPDPSPKRGRLLAEPETTRYTYFLVAEGCAPTNASLVLESRVTSASLRLEVGSGSLPRANTPAAPNAAGVGVDRVPQLLLGEEAPHPWSYSEPPGPQILHLGPGPVRFTESRRFRTSETVELAPGTDLLLGPGVSLIFEGPVHGEGTVARPIRVTRLEPTEAFGGLALQGPGSAGSRLREVQIQGGSKAHDEAVEYTGVVNIHDTHDVTLEGWSIRGTTLAEDVLHANSVHGLTLHELEIDPAPTDGIDLEFVAGDLRGLRIVGAGDDCLDLMGVELRLQDSLLLDCTNNGISAGEETMLTAHGVVIANAKTGVLSKNASDVKLLRSLIYQVQQGLRARRKAIRYGGHSRIGGSEVWIAAAERPLDFDKGSSIEVDGIQIDLPEDGELPHLLDQVLGLDAWDGLDDRLQRWRGGAL